MLSLVPDRPSDETEAADSFCVGAVLFFLCDQSNDIEHVETKARIPFRDLSVIISHICSINPPTEWNNNNAMVQEQKHKFQIGQKCKQRESTKRV